VEHGCVTYIYDTLLLTINSYLITVPQSSSHVLFLLSSLLIQATLFYLIAVDCYSCYFYPTGTT